MRRAGLDNGDETSLACTYRFENDVVPRRHPCSVTGLLLIGAWLKRIEGRLLQR
jgi:hypothetical protein